MSKRLVLCCDGTWNTPDQESGGHPCPTNVTKLALAVADTGDDGKQHASSTTEGSARAAGNGSAAAPSVSACRAT